MRGIDTNVVVRIVVANDAAQTLRARKLIDQALGRDEPVPTSLAFEDEPALEEALVTAILQMLGTCTEGTFELAKESRLPGWFDLTSGGKVYIVETLATACNGSTLSDI